MNRENDLDLVPIVRPAYSRSSGSRFFEDTVPLPARIILEVAATLITAGGLYDLLVPRLPSNLESMCRESPAAGRLARELLHALGGCLVAIGMATGLLVLTAESPIQILTLTLILLLVIPAKIEIIVG
jgi:hypothetical protein